MNKEVQELIDALMCCHKCTFCGKETKNYKAVNPTSVCGMLCIDIMCSDCEVNCALIHKDHGKGTVDDGPDDPDCICNKTKQQRACAAFGCGFCRVDLND